MQAPKTRITPQGHLAIMDKMVWPKSVRLRRAPLYWLLSYVKKKKKKRKQEEHGKNECLAIIVIDSDNSVKYLTHNLVYTSSAL